MAFIWCIKCVVPFLLLYKNVDCHFESRIKIVQKSHYKAIKKTNNYASHLYK